MKGRLLAEGDIDQLSQQLFKEEPYAIQARVSEAKDGLIDRLKQLDGVKQVDRDRDLLDIRCTRDLTADISRIVVESGADLHHLTQKQYGLDEIYHRYFEGGA